MKVFVNFLVEERDNLVKGFVDAAINECTELEIPVEDRRVRRKKRMLANTQKMLALVLLKK